MLHGHAIVLALALAGCRPDLDGPGDAGGPTPLDASTSTDAGASLEDARGPAPALDGGAPRSDAGRVDGAESDAAPIPDAGDAPDASAPDDCPSGRADCNADPGDGCEVALDSDEAHCGGCGMVCEAPGARTACRRGACVLTGCEGAYDDCDGVLDNGCETPLDTLADCGRCGRECAPAGAIGTCDDGVCRIEACDEGRADCDGMRANGCEVDLRSDVAHCGACRARCAFDHASAACDEGACSMVACRDGFADCNGDVADGCEVDVRTDEAHCGGCDAECAPPHAEPVCRAGGCAVRGCEAGRGDCDGDPANGCERSLDSLADCGGCGRACDLPNATERCDDGACALVACREGFADCNGEVADGCEAALLEDESHCGACGTSCAAGSICAEGECR